MGIVFDVLVSFGAVPKQTLLLSVILCTTESRRLSSYPSLPILFLSPADNERYQMHTSVFFILAALILICNKII